MLGNDNPQQVPSIDELLVVPFLCGIQSDKLPDDEVRHRVANFKQTKGFKEAKQALQAREASIRKELELDGRIVGMHELEATFKFEGIPLTDAQRDSKRVYVAQLEAQLEKEE